MNLTLHSIALIPGYSTGLEEEEHGGVAFSRGFFLTPAYVAGVTHRSTLVPGRNRSLERELLSMSGIHHIFSHMECNAWDSSVTLALEPHEHQTPCSEGALGPQNPVRRETLEGRRSSHCLSQTVPTLQKLNSGFLFLVCFPQRMGTSPIAVLSSLAVHETK